MIKIKWNAYIVRICGSIAIYLGAFLFVEEHVIRYLRTGSLTPTTSSIAIGSGTSAMIVAGLLTLAIARALKNIEDRLAIIENNNKTATHT